MLARWVEPLTSGRGEGTASLRLFWSFVGFPILVWGLVAAGATSRTAAGELRLTPSLQKQLRALYEEKASRTVLEKKMDSRLVLALKRERGDPLFRAAPELRPSIEMESDGTTTVHVTCPVTDLVLGAIDEAGGVALEQYPRFDMVRARVPLNGLETLAACPDVRAISLPEKWIHSGMTVTSEGDAAHRADIAREVFGVDGTGVTVCVIGPGVDSLAAAQDAGELPQVMVLPGQGGEGQGDAGTAMLAIVHDLAPGADLGFANPGPAQAGFAQTILDFVDAGCDIVVDDINTPVEPAFQDGIIAQAVDEAVARGVVYIAAAGNAGNLKNGSATVWEGDYADSGVAFDTGAEGSGAAVGTLHDFAPGSSSNTVSADTAGVVLQWTDPLGGSTNDYDLCVVDADLNLVQSSTSVQDGTQNPVEVVFGVTEGQRLVVVNHSAEGRFLRVDAFQAPLEFQTNGAIAGHRAAEGAISVGAVDVSQAVTNGSGGGAQGGPEFGGTTMVQPYSGDGPRQVFFDADGNPFIPLVSRSVPTVVAADCVNTGISGVFNPICGTSMSAPHVAGATALIPNSPDFPPEEIKRLLTETATDIEDPGEDDVSGFGAMDVFSALGSIDPGTREPVEDALELANLTTNYDPTDSRAPAGVLTILPVYKNTSGGPIRDVDFFAPLLSNDNILLNGKGMSLPGPDILRENDTFTLTLEIGLQEASPFRFFVDAFGTSRRRRLQGAGAGEVDGAVRDVTAAQTRFPDTDCGDGAGPAVELSWIEAAARKDGVQILVGGELAANPEGPAGELPAANSVLLPSGAGFEDIVLADGGFRYHVSFIEVLDNLPFDDPAGATCRQGAPGETADTCDLVVELPANSPPDVYDVSLDGTFIGEVDGAMETFTIPDVGAGRRCVTLSGRATRGVSNYESCPREVCCDVSCAPERSFIRGACNGNAELEISTGIFLFGFLFLGRQGPPCREACDANSSGDVDIADGSYILSFLFFGTAPPVNFPECTRAPPEADCETSHEACAGAL